MEYRILGPVDVSSGNQEIALGSRRQRAVLALLLIRANQVVSVDALIDDLWGEDPPPAATGSLQAYISNLRRVLEPDRPPRDPPRVLVTRAPGYVLCVEAQDVDAARFADGAARGRRLLTGGRMADARDLLTAALAEWKGPALADFAGEAFAASEAARLDGLRLGALEDRLQAEVELGLEATAIPELEELVTGHPRRERFWEILMVALYRGGRQGDALRAYQRARQYFGEQLGIEPGPTLRQLESAVLAQVPVLDWNRPDDEPLDVVIAPPAAPDDEPWRPLLVGREQPLTRLEAALDGARAGRGSVEFVVGEAGIGKTRLLQELAHRAGRQAARLAWGSGYEGGSLGFRPWIEVLGALLPDPYQAATALGPEASQLALLVPEIKELVPDVSSPLAAPDANEARFRLYDAVVTFLVRAARRHRRCSSSSTTCTGPTPHPSNCWAFWPAASKTCPCSWWARIGPSMSSVPTRSRRRSSSSPGSAPAVARRWMAWPTSTSSASSGSRPAPSRPRHSLPRSHAAPKETPSSFRSSSGCSEARTA